MLFPSVVDLPRGKCELTRSRWKDPESRRCCVRTGTCWGPRRAVWGSRTCPAGHLQTHISVILIAILFYVILYRISLCLPVCGEAGDAGMMTAVPSSAIRSCPAPLACMGEGVRVGGDMVPLSRPPTHPLGTFRSSGSSKDSMTACGLEPETFTDRQRAI